MNLLIPRVNGNGHGDGDVFGRGLRHRVFDDRHARLEEAADVAIGAKRYFPTLGEIAVRYGLSISELRAHLKTREALQAAANSLIDEMSVENELKLIKLYNQIERRLGRETTLEILTAIERANSETA